jgi:hypothetical protein
MARDLGTRMVAAIFFGPEAFTSYSAISILVSIPATLFATGYYELVLKDSFLWIARGHASHSEGDEGLMKHISRVGMVEDDNVNGGADRGAMSSTVDPEMGGLKKERT